MPWTLTDSLDEFGAAAGELLRAEPVRNNLILTVLDSLRHNGLSAYGDAPPVFGWHQASGRGVDGAFLQTPPYPVLAAQLPPGGVGAAASMFAALAARGGPPGAVNVLGADEDSLTAAWLAVAGGGTSIRLRSRLYRLEGLVPPDPCPAGAARVASPDDLDLLVSWHEAFGAEALESVLNPERTVRDRLSYGGLTLWETGDRPVAMAALSRPVAGVVRVVSVYTPPEHRRHGYAGGATTVVSQAALDAGASEVVLFTDLANPTSNALYQRLGYRPLAERVLLRLETGGQPAGVTQHDATSS
ncbi:MAG TPA: GNAT family N-acetyltransferase [Streptosporangiaceae bacterium]